MYTEGKNPGFSGGCLEFKYYRVFIARPLAFLQKLCYNLYAIAGCGAVGSALPWGGRGRKFESCHSDQRKPLKTVWLSGFLFACFSFIPANTSK